VQPLTCANLNFGDTVQQTLDTATSWTLRQISDRNCHPLYRISNWRVHQDSRFRHKERLTDNHSYCLIDWLNWQFLLLYFSTGKKKGPMVYILLMFFFYFAYIANSKTEVRFRNIFQPGYGFQSRKSLKSIVSRFCSCCRPNFTVVQRISKFPNSNEN
jgi:hypothetical protein